VEPTARVAVVNVDGARALQTAGQIGSQEEIDGALLSLYRPEVTQVIDPVCAWLNLETAVDGLLFPARRWNHVCFGMARRSPAG
jgi:hypothetical protein